MEPQKQGAGVNQATQSVGSTEVTIGRKPGAFSFDEAKKLTSAAWQRDGNRRNWISVLRHAYRTGLFDPNVKTADLTKPLWDRSADWERDMLAINFVRQHIDIIASSVAGNLPDIGFDPYSREAEYIEAADYAAALINGFVEEDGVARKIFAIAKDASVSGHGFGHVRWLRRTRKHTAAEHQAAVVEARRMYFEEMTRLGYGLVEPPEDFDSTVPDEVVIENRPTLEYVSPANVLVPSNLRELEETPWYGIVQYIRLSELRADESYSRAAVEKLAPRFDQEQDSITRRNTQGNNESLVDPLVKVVFFYDVLAHKLIVFGENASEPLYEGDNPTPFDMPCLIDIAGYRDGEQFFGFGDLEGIIGLLDKAALATRQQVLNLDTQGPVFVTWADVLSREDEGKVKGARPYDIIKLSAETHDAMREKFGDGVMPNQAIAQLATTAPLPADVFNVKNELKRDASEIAGVTEFMRGSAGDARISGTASAAAEGWTTVRMSVREQAVNHAVKRVAQLFFKFCQAYLSEDDVVRLVGSMGESWQETVDVQKLSGDFFVRIRTGSMSASNPAARAQRGRETMAIADQLEDRGYDVAGLREIALRDLGIDPRQAKLTKLQPQAPTAAAGMPAMPQQQSPQQMMQELGAPQLPGAEGDFAF
jgi:hypothetical protein